MTSDIQFWDNE